MRFFLPYVLLFASASAAVVSTGSSSCSTSQSSVEKRCKEGDTLCLVDCTPIKSAKRATLDQMSVMYDGKADEQQCRVNTYPFASGPDHKGRGVLAAPIGSRFRLKCTEDDYVDVHYKSNGFVTGSGSANGQSGIQFDASGAYQRNGQTGIGEGDHKFLSFSCTP